MLGCRLASVTSDLENAANSRAKEATDFPTGENELSEVTDSLAREMTTVARVAQATITCFTKARVYFVNGFRRQCGTCEIDSFKRTYC